MISGKKLIVSLTTEFTLFVQFSYLEEFVRVQCAES